MPKFTYYTLNGKECQIDIPQDRIDKDEWLNPGRMGGVPAFDESKPVSQQCHDVGICDDTCKKIDGVGANRIHIPAGVPPFQHFSEAEKSWCTAVKVDYNPLIIMYSRG